MRTQLATAFAVAGVLGTLAISACDLDVPDLNNPSLDDLQNHPTPVSIGAACTGLLAGNRRNHAAENGYIVILGVLGREAYNFDQADPRYVDELLAGTLDQASPFGGNFWAGPYANTRLASIVLQALDKIPTTDTANSDGLTAENKSAIRGFAETIIALDLLEVIVTHDTNGAVIDIDFDPLGPLPPIVDKATTYAEIVRRLESGYTELGAGGEVFPFAVTKGFSGFDTPTTFATFNRAIRARVAAYMGDYPTVLTALAASFIDDNPATADFNEGVYYSYSTKPGDTPNALINPNIYVHPSIEADAEKTPAGTPDARFVRKVGPAKQPGTSGERSSELAFNKLYPDPESSVPLIRNEELILLKAEALFFTGDPTAAVAELNIVRVGSGRLAPLTGTPDQPTFIAELLYEREFSLLFEGHRWIDVRRLGQLSTLPIFVAHDADMNPVPDALNVRFPIPTAECDARPGEPACALGSE
jgi:hypothetical protein